jgi:ribonuclease III
MGVAFEALEQRLGHQFQNRALLEGALTHRSWSAERSSTATDKGDNEQLEFLGDAVLGFVVSEALFSEHPSANEGQLSQWKAHLVSSKHLHACALELGLGEFLKLGRGEERNGGRHRRTLLANAFEAVIAGMYLDAGLGITREFILRNVLALFKDEEQIASISSLNYKSVLQEHAQARGLATPEYSIVGTAGPEHAKVFSVEVRVGDEFTSRATGSSKKAASQDAARLLVERLLEDQWSGTKTGDEHTSKSGIVPPLGTGAIVQET